jgi:8-oxo-dGTP pyrophosphatase MutT (NUDIX family)
MFIPEAKYKQILNYTVNLCTDVCLRYNNKVLLIRRNEEPCKNVYWPIGGRIHKGETADQAARRKIKEEIGIDFEGDLYPIGFYEDQYTENSFSKKTDYCTLSIVFGGDLVGLPNIVLDDTSEAFGLFDILPERFRVKTFLDLGKLAGE